MKRITLARVARLLVVPAWLLGCDDSSDGGGGSGAQDTTSSGVRPADPVDGFETGGAGGENAWPLPEDQPEPAEGAGLSDPSNNSLHNHGCGGVDWQRIHGWLLLPHAAPELGPADEMERCIERYGGWVTNEADAAGVSRASVYAALAATGQCDADRGYDGALLSGEQCASVHDDLSSEACAEQMQRLRSFGVSTLAAYIAATDEEHDRDIPRIAASLGTGAVACGGDDRWKLVAPAGFIDRYVAAYNAYKASSTAPPDCAKRIVVTVALYTGIDDPGADGVTAANGCWTYERVSKQNAEWKLCNYDGTVTHAAGVKWAYDDTSTAHDAGTDQARIGDCMEGVPGRGYVYMTNRGSGWPKRVTDGVAVHFAEIYSGQFTVDDQFSLWQSDNEPGEPMVNFGEPTTTATKIRDVTDRVCPRVGDGGYYGVYVYPESLRGGRMSALVEALNACTAP